MNVAVYCPGPSMPRVVSSDADVVVCVNHAAKTLPCDYWVTLHPELVDEFTPPGPPPILVTRRTESVDGYKTMDVDAMCIRQRFSTITALAFCLEVLNADRVDVYGADMIVESNLRYRREGRWEIERDLWKQWIEKYEECGARLMRHSDTSLENGPVLYSTRLQHGT